MEWNNTEEQNRAPFRICVRLCVRVCVCLSVCLQIMALELAFGTDLTTRHRSIQVLQHNLNGWDSDSILVRTAT